MRIGDDHRSRTRKGGLANRRKARQSLKPSSTTKGKRKEGHGKIIQTPLNCSFKGFNESLDRIILVQKFEREHHHWFR